MLKELAPAVVVLARLDSVEATIHWWQENPPPDLILLAIHLADGASFELFEHVQIKCPVIFTMAYDEYALRAFKVNAVDYLLKPIKINELAAALDKYSRVFAPPLPDYTALLRTAPALENGSPYLRRMLIRFNNSINLVEVSDAVYFYTKDKLTFVVTRSMAKRFPVDYPLDQLENRLDPAVFFSINRQFIINVAAIHALHSYSKSRVKVELEPITELETIVSTERSAAFKKWLVGEQG